MDTEEIDPVSYGAGARARSRAEGEEGPAGRRKITRYESTTSVGSNNDYFGAENKVGLYDKKSRRGERKGVVSRADSVASTVAPTTTGSSIFSGSQSLANSAAFESSGIDHEPARTDSEDQSRMGEDFYGCSGGAQVSSSSLIVDQDEDIDMHNYTSTTQREDVAEPVPIDGIMQEQMLRNNMNVIDCRSLSLDASMEGHEFRAGLRRSESNLSSNVEMVEHPIYFNSAETEFLRRPGGLPDATNTSSQEQAKLFLNLSSDFASQGAADIPGNMNSTKQPKRASHDNSNSQEGSSSTSGKEEEVASAKKLRSPQALGGIDDNSLLHHGRSSSYTAVIKELYQNDVSPASFDRQVPNLSYGTTPDSSPDKLHAGPSIFGGSSRASASCGSSTCIGTATTTSAASSSSSSIFGGRIFGEQSALAPVGEVEEKDGISMDDPKLAETPTTDALNIWEVLHPIMVESGYLQDEKTLLTLDLVCKSFHRFNCELLCWKRVGIKRFYGIELQGGEVFEKSNHAVLPKAWKARYGRFKRRLLEFRLPFGPPCVPGPCRSGNFEYSLGYNQISKVLTPDEVAYTKATLQKGCVGTMSLYVEVTVTANADNLSLAIVDFDEGGKSSVTFSPDTGAVIKETKVRESPRKVLGSYIQPLERKLTKFEGKMSMYIENGCLAFFRKYETKDSTEDWECTGFIIAFDWAQEGNRLTPCIAFRDVGPYSAQITSFGTKPPPVKLEPAGHSPYFSDDSLWSHLNWEAANN